MESDSERRRRLRDSITNARNAVDRLREALPVSAAPHGQLHFIVPNVSVPLNQGAKRIKLETDNLSEYLFNDEATKDFTIISGTGTRVKCHKLVLKARSNWFVTMLQNPEMTEVKEGELELCGMSDWGVNRLVMYLYGMEIPMNELTPDYALQLLQNGHAYELQGLVKNIGNILVEKDIKWFKKEDIDALLELYFFTQKLEKDALMCRLNGHLLQIMSGMPSKTIRNAQSFQELSKEDSTNLLCKLYDILQAKTVASDNSKCRKIRIVHNSAY